MVGATILSVLFYFLPKDFIWGNSLFTGLNKYLCGYYFSLVMVYVCRYIRLPEWKTGRRATGLIFSSSSMSQKFGWTIGGALTGWLPSLFRFQANVIQSDFAQTGICMMMSIFPGNCHHAISILHFTLSVK